jgi:hypothetical protein
MPYFDDSGKEINLDLIPKPSLCVGCLNDDTVDENERMLCNLTRFDQNGEEEFNCFAYVVKVPDFE